MADFLENILTGNGGLERRVGGEWGEGMGSLGTGNGPAAQSNPHHHARAPKLRARARFVRASIIVSLDLRGFFPFPGRSSSHSSRPFGYRPKR